MTPVVNAQSIAAIAFVAREEFGCERAGPAAGEDVAAET
jgi:hypothetical protein